MLIGALRALTVSALLPVALPVVAAATEPARASVERGRYLVETILACGNCHTPKGPDGVPIADRNLAGGGLAFRAPFFEGSASNITPDRETGIGGWSADEIKRAITTGERPDHGPQAGVALAPMMWVNFYKALIPEDLDAVVSYLQSVPPVRNAVAPPVYKRRIPRDPYPDAETGFQASDMTDPVRRGAYLVTIGHCMECHTPAKAGVTQYELALGQGGKQYAPKMVQGYPATWQGAVSRNISAHPTDGLGAWSDEEIKRAITQGISRDGRILQPPMGFHWYRGMNSSDLAAIVAWLRTLPPKP